MACPRCRKKPPPGAAFCPKCGASLTASGHPQHPAGIDPNLNAIAKTAARLCDATDAQILLTDGATLRLAAHHGPTLTTRQLGEPFPVSRDSLHGRAVLERRVIQVRDLKAAVRTQYPALEPRQRATGIRTMLAAPLLYDGAAIGVIAIRRSRVRPFTAKQIALLEAFAEHAATAIEKTRLAQVLAEALEQQTATSEILRVIAGSPTDLQPVLDAIAASAARLCDSIDAQVFRIDGAVLHLAASHGPLPKPEPRPIVRGSVAGRAVLDRRTIHVHDLAAESDSEWPEGKAMQKRIGHRTILSTPLLREGVPLGAIAIRRMEVRPFSDKQIRLLETFADQAVIAIENVRLFTELEARNRDLSVALDRQTATSEILRVIGSSPTNAVPVFDAIVRSAVQLLGGFSGAVLRLVGDDLHLAAITSTSDSGDEAIRGRFPRPLADTPIQVQAIQERTPSVVADIEKDPRADGELRRVARARGYRSMLQVPMLREGSILGVITVTRREPGPFAAEEIALLQTFADQAVIAIENVRLFTELQERNLAVTQAHAQVTEALEQQTATSEILRVIASSPTDLQPVMDAVISSAARLCGAYDAGIFRRDGESLELVAHNGLLPASIGLRIPLVRGTTTGRSVLERRTIHVADVQAEAADFPEGSVLGKEWGHRAILNVPLIREGVAIGVIQLRRAEANPFTDKQIALLETFADQAVIAIENVRLFKELGARNAELTEALTQQTATSEVLGVISRSPTDIQPVLDAVVESAARLCEAYDASIVLRRDNRLVMAAHHGPIHDPSAIARALGTIGGYALSLDRGTIGGRTVLDARAVHIADVQVEAEEFPEASENARRLGFHTMLSVPLMREGVAIGAIQLPRTEVRLFTERQVALLKTFADQAVIAIENVRLFTELEARNADLTEGLERETATGEILRVISSSPTDIQPVLDTVVKSAARLCDAYDAQIFQREGDQLLFVAHHGPMPSGPVGEYTVPLVRGTINGRSVLEGLPVHVADVQAERDEFPEGSEIARRYGHRTVLSLPLMREGVAIGTISVRRAEIRPFTERQIALLKTFADQAVIAIENVRLFKELEVRNRDLSVALDRQTATSEILRVIGSSPTDAQPVFDAIARSAVRLLGGFSGAVFRLVGDDIHLAAITSTSDSGDEAMRVRYPRPLADSPLPAQVVRERAPCIVSDTEADPLADDAMRQIARARGFRSQLQVPMLREGTPIGVISVTRREPGPFAAEEIALLQTFADQAVIAIENVRLFRDLTEALEQQTATSEVLTAISQSPTDVQPIFDVIVRSAARLCEAAFSGVALTDGEWLTLPAAHGLEATELESFLAGFPIPLGPNSTSGRAILEGRVVHVKDQAAEPAYSGNPGQRVGTRSILAVPMIREGSPIGAITVWRREVRPFSDRQIALLQTFADQAVIAIENVRLFKELEARNRDLSVALEQQTATSEILGVISQSPTDVQPVLEAVARNASRLCSAANVSLYRVEGDLLRKVAEHESGPQLTTLRVGETRPITRTSVSGRAIIDRTTVHVRDHQSPEVAAEFPDGARRDTGIRTTVGIPLLREGLAIGAFTVYRTELRPFSESEIALLQTFADQAVIAIENVRLFKELEARNRDLTEALEQQTATSEILRVISSSPTDVQPVFDAIVRNAGILCGALFGVIWRYEGDLVHIAGVHNISPGELQELRREYPRPIEDANLHPLVRSGDVINVRDTEMDEGLPISPALRMRWRTRGVRSAVVVPLRRENEVVGAIGISHRDVGAFSASRIELLKTFADQAVIAIENVRLFKELEARNRDLTATGEILQVISRSPTDAQPVFDTIAERAMRLCDAAVGFVSMFDGALIHVRALANMSSEGVDAIHQAFPAPPSRGSATGRVILTGDVVQVPDALEDPEYQLTGAALAVRFRGVLGAPMLHQGRAIGVISVGRPEPGMFSEEQVQVLKTFADQAVIAIENVRLFKELEARNRDLTTALEQQTATSEILRVISQSQTDVQPVFDTIIRSAVRLCDGLTGALYRFDGELIDQVAQHNYTPEALDEVRRTFPMRPNRAILGGRAVLERAVIHLRDVELDLEYRPLIARAAGVRSILSVPMLRDGAPAGAIAVARAEVGGFSDNQVELLKTFADQAVIAIENVRLFTELDARNRDLTEALEQQTATSEILRVISQSQTDVQPVFDTIVQSAAELCDAVMGNLQQFDGERMHLVATHNIPPEALKLALSQYPMRLDKSRAANRAVLNRAVVNIPDVFQDPDYGSNAARLAGWRSVLSVPMLREGKSVGAITVARAAAGTFSDNHVDLLKTFADQAVIAVENVRLFKELQARTHELTRSVEQLTALGEVSRAVSSTLDIETVLQTVVSRARQLASADGCLIYEYDEASQHFHLRATDNLAADYVEAIRGVPIRKGEGVSGRAAEMREPFQVADITQAAGYQTSVRDVTIRAGYRAALSVPLLREDEIIGSLILIRKTPGEFSAEVIEALKTFATQSALAIQNARLFREIEEKGRQLEIASRHKSQFLANMSHELRTPLNAILGYTELLQDGIYGQIPDKAQETMQRVDRSGRHLLALINDVLDLSKIEAGQLTLSLGDYSLKEVVQTVVTALEPLAAEKRLALTVTVAPDLPVGRGDDRRLSQVLLNLVGNAVKFTDAGEVRVEAKASDGAFLVSVSDTGPGIAAEDQARIFEEFQQVDTSNTRKKGGTGLGLSIAKRILALHGGRIWVESAPGKGSTFFFTLPVRVERMVEAT